jgi:hypothetical protein
MWVHDLIRPLIPEEWVIKPAITGTIESLVPVVYITFRAIDHGDSERLPSGQVRCEMVVEVTPAITKDGEGEDSADDGVVELIAALNDKFIAWARADKRRAENGALGWEVTLSTICRLRPPETP